MKTNSACCDPKAMAVALARWCVGIIFLFAGILKLKMAAQMGLSAVVDMMIVKPFTEKTFLPEWLLVPYGYTLPFVETLLGAALILGLFRNPTLFFTTLLLISLMFGQFLLAMKGDEKAAAGMFQNTVLSFFAAGLLFLHEHDRWVIPCGCRRKENCCGPVTT